MDVVVFQGPGGFREYSKVREIDGRDASTRERAKASKQAWGGGGGRPVRTS